MRPSLHIDETLLRPGLRLAVGVSGGADSVALLRALAERSRETGVVLHAAHLHHGLRGADADNDLEFVRALAAELGLAFHEARVETASEARADATTGKAGESIEAAARRLRYGWFRKLMASKMVEAVATAHTRDDQAETVLGKFLRGAWTEGLSGIHPAVEFPEGQILRPLLCTTRADVEAYLRARGQNWREDATNAELTYTRNRIRHELLPLLEGWNPRLREHLAQMAVLARDEESWWQEELTRLAPQLLLAGRPVRGGGRTGADDGFASGALTSKVISLDIPRLASLPSALQRRLLRYAAGQLGASPDFEATEALRTLAFSGRAGQKRELAQGLCAERTHRELRLAARAEVDEVVPEYCAPIPGEMLAPAFGLRLRFELSASVEAPTGKKAVPGLVARLRNWRPGDRVKLRYSSGPRKVKDVLERLRVTGSSRSLWPVLEVNGRIVWMRGAEVEPDPAISVTEVIMEPQSENSAQNT